MTVKHWCALAAAAAAIALTGAAGVAGAAGAANAAGAASDAARQGMKERQDLEIVDCLLPGQVRQLGAMTYLSPRRPTRTTAADCRIRGGEYVAYDRADYKSALRVWMGAANAGDPEAMTNVGEIYERGLGATPNYAAAAIWYQKASDKGFSRALFDLGTLYEQGLGVPQDRLKALNLYRQAWGVPADSLLYESAARKEQESLRAQYEQEIAEKNAQLEALKKELERAQSQLEEHSAGAAHDSAVSAAEISALRKLVEELQAARDSSVQRLAAIAQTREPSAAPAAPPLAPQAMERVVQGLDFGRYYALVIGDQRYRSLESLATPHADAERVAHVLEDKYGFNVQILEDADDVSILRALNDLNRVLKPDDNLLLYYAGHGYRLKSSAGESGFWLPVNADPPPDDTYWIPNEQITGHLARIVARRVLVVADSCYAGLLSTDPDFLFLDSNAQFSLDYVKFKLPKRARLLMSSGGDEPVLDSGGNGDSVFARAFIDVLESNTDLLPSPALFLKIEARMQAESATQHLRQTPEFKSIKGAGHEVGDFFFVPRTRLTQSTPRAGSSG